MPDQPPLKCPGCGQQADNRVGEAVLQGTTMPLFQCPGCEAEFVVTPDGAGIIVPDLIDEHRLLIDQLFGL